MPTGPPALRSNSNLLLPRLPECAMSASHPSRPDPDAELRSVDAILDKADALLRRHQSPLHERGNDSNAADDLPVLLDVVDDSVLHPKVSGQATAPLPAEPLAEDIEPTSHTGLASDDVDLIEDLVSLDTSINRAIENWLTREMPPLVVHELERFNAQLRDRLLEHARATLLPTLSKRIATRIERHARR